MGALQSRSEHPMLEETPRCRFCRAKLSSADSHVDLTANLKKHDVLKNAELIDAFRAVDRGDFVPEYPYEDAAAPIGAGAQASAPHVHAAALELVVEVLPKGRDVRVLDIGSGCGFLCTVIAQLLSTRQQKGKVLGIEHIGEFVQHARASALQNHSDLFENGYLEIRHQDALSFNIECSGESEPFDIVHCGAAVQEPEPWLLALVRPGGRVVVPMGPTDAPQELCAIDKCMDGTIQVSRHIAVLYVPVVNEAEQRERGRNWEEVVDRCITNADEAHNEDIYD